MTTLRDATTSAVRVAYLGDARIDVREAAAAPPAAGQVRIRVAYVGLCGTDLHIVHGAMDARVSTPLVFGHEMSGTIESLGEGVDGWRVGDRVTVMPLDWDGTCPACLAGHQHICQNLDFIGIDSPGALQSALERASIDAGRATAGSRSRRRGPRRADGRRRARRAPR